MSLNRVQKALRLLKTALRWSVAHKHPARAARIRKSRRALFPVQQHVAPAPVPVAVPDHKLFIPGVVRKPIPVTQSDPEIIVAGAVFHVAVSEADSLHDFFEHDGGVESTGYIRRDGTIEQYRPLNIECDAQFDGNSWIGADGQRYGFTSWETQGMGRGEWTPEQLDAIKEIIRFHHDHWGTPLRVCPTWNGDGFGYHRLFPQWNHNAHTCPGDARVAQFRSVIVPWLRAGAPE